MHLSPFIFNMKFRKSYEISIKILQLKEESIKTLGYKIIPKDECKSGITKRHSDAIVCDSYAYYLDVADNFMDLYICKHIKFQYFLSVL